MELTVGSQTWLLDVPADQAVKLHRQAIPSVPAQSPRELVRAALEKPYQFEPMHRALTPDDQVAIVLDTTLPHIGELLAGVIEHLHQGGITPEAVTIVVPPGASPPGREELPEKLAAVKTEIHDPDTRKKLAYIATTRAGRRIYLNRTVAEADFCILLTDRGYDPFMGYGGAEAALFPALSEAEVRTEFASEFSKFAPDDHDTLRAEACEVAQLLGSPFLVQVIRGSGDTVQAVIAGMRASSDEGIRWQNARWRCTVDERPQTVLATVSGASQHITFLDLAKAAACAARVLNPGGRIAVLSTAEPELGAGIDVLRRYDNPRTAVRALEKAKPDDWAACYLWCYAANRAGSLYLASGLTETLTEELFATKVTHEREAQRLIDAGERILVIPDAHRAMVTCAPSH